MVNGLVLIKVATVVVDIMLLYILPKKRIYTYEIIFCASRTNFYCRRHKFEMPEEAEIVRKQHSKRDIELATMDSESNLNM